MILDTSLTFIESTSVAATTGTALVGDVADLGLTSEDYGSGMPKFLVIQVTTAFAGSGASVAFKLASDSSATIAVDGTATEHVTTDTFGVATLVKGYQIVVPLPSHFPDYERYLGLLVVTSGATTTAGSISAFLTLDAQTWRSYADAAN